MASQPPTTLAAAVGAGDSSALAIIGASEGPRLSRGQLHQQAVALAHGLRAAGIKPGDCVSLADVNTVDFVIAFLGITYAQAVAAPLNPNYKPDEFKFFMADAASKLLLLPASGNAAAEQAAAELNVPIARTSLGNSSGQTFLQLQSEIDRFSFSTQQQRQQQQLADPPQANDIALFLYTSGTTSKPKGVPLSHGNLTASLQNIVATYELCPADRSLLVMPLFHVHGLMGGLLAPLAAGAAVILPAEGRFAASSFWADATAHGATFYTAVPTMHQILLGRADRDYPRDSPPPLRFIRSCSSSLAAATLHKLEAAFGVPVLEAYAMTEASHQMTSNPLPTHGPHKPGTVGTAQGSIKVAILDEKNQRVPTGTVGEVCIQGPSITRGYHNRPEANAEAFAGGWFHTGDQGFLDEDGYLQLTGRLKELINRGGEKISPIEVDGALLSHPAVAEAVAFGAPDEKYGEAVAAAVVLAKPADDPAALVADIRRHTGTKLAKFKVPEQIFITDTLPKGPTGKIQRRFMAGHFIKPGGGGGSSSGGSQQAPAPAQPQRDSSPQEAAAGPSNGFAVVAAELAARGVRLMFGVVGIPVTELASAAQAAGIRFIGFRNEQAAGYAAAAAGYLSGVPAVLLTVSGPGVVHGLAGLAHAHVNCWPLLMVSGSAEQAEVGKGAFQELDQVATAQPYCKYTARAASARDLGPIISAAIKATVSGRPGAAYIDIPSNILMGPAPSGARATLPLPPPPQSDAAPLLTPVGHSFPFAQRATADADDVRKAVQLLQGARRPLVVIGKGAAYSQADAALLELVSTSGIPFLATAMGRGVVPDSHRLCVNAARSAALAGADVALVVGARLNWQLHFGEPPKWGAAVKFLLLDAGPSETDMGKAAAVVLADAAAGARQISAELAARGGIDIAQIEAWGQHLAEKVTAARAKLGKRLEADAFPLDYGTTLRIIRDAVTTVVPAPVISCEGANTMDNARIILEPVEEGRLRLDAGTWGTMGVGLGYAIAAAAARPDRLSVAIEGDSAFGFSGMEVETIVRYNLPVVIFVFNNGGIYGGDRRPEALAGVARQGALAGGFADDPIPTAFVPDARYEMLAEAFGGDSYSVNSGGQLAAACRLAFELRRPAVINVTLDPMAGVESGNVHAFNAPKAKL